MAGWVKDITTSVVTQTDNQLVITTGLTVAAGNHVMVIGMRSNLTSTDTLATLTTSASGATTSIDAASLDLGGGAFDSIAVGSIYCPNGMTNTDTVTLLWTNASAFTFFAGALYEYTGLATVAWTDKTAQSSGFAASIDSTATATTAQADELIFGALGVIDAAQTITATSGLATRAQLQSVGATLTLCGADKIVSATGTYSATGTWSPGGADNQGAIVVTYKVSAVVPGTTIAGVGRRLQGLLYTQG